MKKVLFTLFLSFLVLTGCSHINDTEDNGNDDKKSNSKPTSSPDSKEQKSSNKKENSKKENSKKDEDKNQTSSNTNDDSDNNNDEKQNQQENMNTENNENENNSLQNTAKVDVSNITDRATLVSIINSNNYSEADKILAYNSAVSNGVIPQGNVMEGPASAAYASSLRVESGKEKSVYEHNQDNSNVSSQDNEGEDPNAEINAATTEDEYVDALRKKYNGGLSSAELQTKTAIEQGYYDGDDAEEVYKTIQEREQDIANGKYDQYKQ
ncbi:hypothetical protein BUY49_07535 [Staphylococcus devriesei]|uniref:hypothetical protein n=1 Tax=Staphylococcus devriesei TaxID=586733 RepID=UPI000E687D8F|nr:hypothetical protein [Staphylococcus devriesei]RIL71166.1 hypothetical protein BUY49_07535 [Staphylococcus devriesei]